MTDSLRDSLGLAGTASGVPESGVAYARFTRQARHHSQSANPASSHSGRMRYQRIANRGSCTDASPAGRLPDEGPPHCGLRTWMLLRTSFTPGTWRAAAMAFAALSSSSAKPLSCTVPR